MSTRAAQTVAIAAAVIAAASLSATAQDTTHVETHHVAVEHQVAAAATDAEHEAAAQRFEEEATDFDKQAAEHEKMGPQYRQLARLNRKATYAALADHCDRLSTNLRAAAAEAREMARLHHDVAKLVAK